MIQVVSIPKLGGVSVYSGAETRLAPCLAHGLGKTPCAHWLGLPTRPDFTCETSEARAPQLACRASNSFRRQSLNAHGHFTAIVFNYYKYRGRGSLQSSRQVGSVSSTCVIHMPSTGIGGEIP